MFTINYSCEAIYNGSYLQSYVLIILSVGLFTVLKYLAEEVVIPFILTIVIDKKKNNDDPQPSIVENPMLKVGTQGYNELNVVHDDIELSNSNSVPKSEVGTNIDSTSIEGTTDMDPKVSEDLSLKNARVIFLYFQGLVAVVSFILHCKRLNVNQTNWNRYQNLYGEVLNSAVLTFLISCWIYVSQNENSDQKKKVMVMSFAATGLTITCLFFIPPLLTHIIPAIVIYCWIFVLFLLVFLIALIITILCVGHCLNGGAPLTEGQLKKTIEIFTRLAVIFLFQTMFNYMYIFYKLQPSNSSEYMDVIYTEFALRSQTFCLFKHIWELGSSLVFFSWL